MGKAQTKMRPRFLSNSLTKTEFDRIYRRSKAFSKKLPQTRKAWFDRASQTVFLVLDNVNQGVIGLPRSAFRFLTGVRDEDVAKVNAEDFSLYWPAIDEGADLFWIINQVFGGYSALQTYAAYTRGLSRSAKKIAAARRNGRKGGRPRKKAA